LEVKNGMSEEERKRGQSEAEEVSEILGVVSEKVPALIKGLISSVFSEEAGRNMGKAAAAFYKELKEGGIPDEVALKMTREYMEAFTNFSEFIKGAVPSKGKPVETVEECKSK